MRDPNELLGDGAWMELSRMLDHRNVKRIYVDGTLIVQTGKCHSDSDTDEVEIFLFGPSGTQALVVVVVEAQVCQPGREVPKSTNAAILKP